MLWIHWRHLWTCQECLRNTHLKPTQIPLIMFLVYNLFIEGITPSQRVPLTMFDPNVIWGFLVAFGVKQKVILRTQGRYLPLIFTIDLAVLNHCIAKWNKCYTLRLYNSMKWPWPAVTSFDLWGSFEVTSGHSHFLYFPSFKEEMIKLQLFISF